MSSNLTENEIEELTDLFAAFKLMQTLKINPRGCTNLEDAKCRLQQYLQEQYGVGKPRHSNAANLFQEVLERDKVRRTELSRLYGTAIDYIRALPVSRRRELEKNVIQFDAKLEKNIQSVQKSDCAILVAGEVSAGKSSLLNLLLGTELLPTSLLSCTSVMCELRHSERKYAVAHPWDANKRPERVDLNAEDPGGVLARYVHQKGDRSKKFPYQMVEIFWPFPLLKGGIFIVDSPGIGESREMTEVVKKFLSSAFAFIYVINSSNAGGLQPDRLQDLLATLSRKDDELSTFDPRSAIFVCNKWDQVPLKEVELVKKDTRDKLRQCWPGIKESQIFQLSAIKAAKSLQDSDFMTQDYIRLLEGIESLLPISLQCKLENHYRWLSQLLRRSAFHLRVYIANETRSDEERKELTEHLHNQLDKLAGDTKRVSHELKFELHQQATSAGDQLIAHLASASTRTRLMNWELSECPDGDDWDIVQEILIAKVNKRIRREVHEWDTKNGIFVDIQMDLLRNFQVEFALMEDQLDIIEGGMIGRGGRPGESLSFITTLKSDYGLFKTPNLTFGQKVALGMAAPLLLPLGVVAGMFVLPVAVVKAIREKMEDTRLLEEYRKNKQGTLAMMTDDILESFLEKNNLNKLIHTQLQAVTQNLDSMIKSIPTIIDADRIMIDKLQEEREASEVSLAEQYLPLFRKCRDIQGRLNYFYVTSIREYDIDMTSLEWNASLPPVASGSFGDVYSATWRIRDDRGIESLKHVAIKIRREHVDQENVTDILIEEENLRRFQHPNIVTYHGTAARRSQSENGELLQFVMVMELCDTTLRTRICGKSAKNPGKLGDCYVLQHDAMRRAARYVAQTASALVYLHDRALVHRDLTPQNILLTSSDDVKLADVGLTKPERDISGTKCGTTSYAAPEVLEGSEYDKSSDIYSLGVITWELWYGRLAQDDLAAVYQGDVEGAIRSGTRPSLASIHEPPEDWKTVIKACWSHNVKTRPTAAYCHDFFHRIHSTRVHRS